MTLLKLSSSAAHWWQWLMACGSSCVVARAIQRGNFCGVRLTPTTKMSHEVRRSGQSYLYQQPQLLLRYA